MRAPRSRALVPRPFDIKTRTRCGKSKNLRSWIPKVARDFDLVLNPKREEINEAYSELSHIPVRRVLTVRTTSTRVGVQTPFQKPRHAANHARRSVIFTGGLCPRWTRLGV